MGRVGFIGHPTFLLHEMGSGHPESPERLRSIRSHLESTGTWGRLLPLEPRPASKEWVQQIHNPSYMQRLEQLSPASGYVSLDPDTIMCPGTLNAAFLAVGAAMTGVDSVMSQEVDQAFCAIRPPGHHAETDRAMGFCFLNTIAIAAKYIQGRYGLQRVLIVDWDVHHGNGTQQAFYEDPSVLYFSVHQYPHYPGTGGVTETGEGAGEGMTINVPLAVGQGNEDYQEAFQKILVPAADAFKPEWILISAGFDAHRDDPLAGMNITAEGFGALTNIVTTIANRYASGRIVSCLEGGYHPVALGTSVERHLLALLEA